jgi:hypothetical protein
MDLLIAANGQVRCIYSEEIDLSVLGTLSISRGSHVEPVENGQWLVDLSPVNGPTLGPFPARSVALAEEVAWLSRHWLVPGTLTNNAP